MIKCKLFKSKSNSVLGGKIQEFLLKKKKAMDISHQLLLLSTMILNVLPKAINQESEI